MLFVSSLTRLGDLKLILGATDMFKTNEKATPRFGALDTFSKNTPPFDNGDSAVQHVTKRASGCPKESFRKVFEDVEHLGRSDTAFVRQKSNTNTLTTDSGNDRVLSLHQTDWSHVEDVT